MSKYKVGIYGVGMVGGALKRYFEKKPNYQIYLYDKKGLGSLEELNKADYIYVCLPTPYIPEKGCDTSIIEEGIDLIKGNKVIIIKSTVVPGTTQALQDRFPQHKFLFNPEFLTEETSDQDMSFPDRQIIGYTKQSFTIAKDILLQLPLASYERIVPTQVAEFVKYAGNTWFSVKVATNNELYDLAKKTGLTEEEWEEVVSGMAADKRIGRTHLTINHKGKRGYWGHCLPKDIKALLDFAKEKGVEMPVRSATNQYNDKLLKSQGIKEYV
jgi:UDPglucose 6-dehydrogenase